MYDDAIRRLFYDPLGPVGQKLARHAAGIEQRAKEKAPVRKGDLRDSIHTRPTIPGGMPEPGWEPTMYVEVGTDLVVRGANVGRLQELGVGPAGEYPLPERQTFQSRSRTGNPGYRNAFLRPALEEEFGR